MFKRYLIAFALIAGACHTCQRPSAGPSTAAGGVFEWAVFAPTTGTPAGALAGEYVGASGDLGIIAGVSTNVLIGGSGRTFALQPVSLGGSVAVKVALGISVLKLRPGH
jgi:uncharacterized Zn-binding protein involved in type VI secretion